MAGFSPLHLVFGFGGWLAWFGTVYGSLALGCAAAAAAKAEFDHGLHLGLLAFTALVALALGGAAVVFWRHARRLRQRMPAHWQSERPPPKVFLAVLTCLCYASAALATLAVGAPLLLYTPCV